MPEQTLPHPGDARIDEALAEIEELASDDPALALELIAAFPAALRSSPEIRLVQADAHAALEQWQQVVEVLRPAVEADPDDSDVHHLLGVAYGELGDPSRCRDHFLWTLELDEKAAAEEPAPDEGADEEIVAHARQAFEELPSDYRSRLGNVLIVLEQRPSQALVEEGFDPRAYGLFEGPDHADQLSQALTTQVTRIVLFAANLFADFPDPEDLAEEVRVTVLHEVGHYFGLDEDDMERLGLD